LSFKPSAVASLAPMLLEAAKSVRAPSGKPLYDAWRATTMRDLKSAAPPPDSDLVETRIGSGSDHTVFLNHLGRPVINLGFEGDYGVYHSAYDDHYWMTHLGDPDFAYHVALTRIWGVVALRLANADILPYDFAENGAALQDFLSELEHRTKLAPSRLSLTPLATGIAEFERAGKALEVLTLRDLQTSNPDGRRIKALNSQLLQVESNWLDPRGIPGRPWFQHLLYAARYTYAHLKFPGLTEAIEAGNWQEAQNQEDVLAAALEKNTRLLQSAAASWGSAPR
jgi:N-acetylated-alpha-linked acidic dipeptidase